MPAAATRRNHGEIAARRRPTPMTMSDHHSAVGGGDAASEGTNGTSMGSSGSTDGISSTDDTPSSGSRTNWSVASWIRSPAAIRRRPVTSSPSTASGSPPCGEIQISSAVSTSSWKLTASMARSAVSPLVGPKPRVPAGSESREPAVRPATWRRATTGAPPGAVPRPSTRSSAPASPTNATVTNQSRVHRSGCPRVGGRAT